MSKNLTLAIGWIASCEVDPTKCSNESMTCETLTELVHILLEFLSSFAAGRKAMNLKAAIGMALVTSGLLVHGTASAADVMCQTITNNHMLVDDAFVSACIDAGLGNIGQGNQANDDFLNQLPPGHGYTTIGNQSFTQAGTTGTFAIDATQWANFDDLFIGFKFGTGNQADEWFIYQLQDLVSAGTWKFVNVFGRGGGLSHVSLYGRGDGSGDDDEIPEPGTLALVGLALVGAAATRRRRS